MAAKTASTVFSNQKYMGKEPEFGTNELTESELVRSLSWYNYNKDSEDSKQYLNAYCISKGVTVDLSKHSTNTFGWLARMISRGAKIGSSNESKLIKYLSNIQYGNVINLPKTSASKNNPLDKWLPTIEVAIDNFDQPFDCYKFIVDNSIPQSYVKQIESNYVRLNEELSAVRQKADRQLTEGYKAFTKAQLTQYQTLVQTIIADCQRYLGNVKKQRKPKAAKKKSVQSVLKHFKWMQTDPQTKLSSEDPAKIIGAKSVYVVNVKYKTLTMFVANADSGLNISRTSIVDYDPTKSVTKRIGRVFEKTIESLNNGTKISRPKIVAAIKNEPAAFTDRLNENCVILKVDR